MFIRFQKCLLIKCLATSPCIEHVLKKCWNKIKKLCTTYVWIYLIASTQGICIIRVLVTIWCSNNSPSMKCTHVNFWSLYSLRSSSPIFSYFNASLFLVCVVLSRNCYACFMVFLVWFVFFAECSGTSGLRMFECLSIQYVCCSFPWSTIPWLFCSPNNCRFA